MNDWYYMEQKFQDMIDRMSDEYDDYFDDYDDNYQERIYNPSYTNNKLYTKVVGVTYGNSQIFIPSLKSGQTLTLVREPNNPYDRNAIAVYADENMIGHISKEISKDMAPKMDINIFFSCKVVEVTGGGAGKVYGVNIMIFEDLFSNDFNLNSKTNNTLQEHDRIFKEKSDAETKITENQKHLPNEVMDEVQQNENECIKNWDIIIQIAAIIFITFIVMILSSIFVFLITSE